MVEILCFHIADDGVVHKPGCQVDSCGFHCNLIQSNGNCLKTV